MVVGCEACRSCRAGRAELCEHLVELGIHANGGFAEFMVAPARNLHRLPPQLAFAEATAADPLASALHGLHAAAVEGDDTVAVFGLGAIGLHTIQLARALGGGRVIGVGRRDEALALARALGAAATVDLRAGDPIAAVRALTEGGPTITVEATGAPEVLPLVFQAAAPGGRVVVLGIFHGPSPLPVDLLVRKELQVFGRLCYTWGEYEHCLGEIGAGRLRSLVSHMLPLSRMAEALALVQSRRATKVVLQP
jgi:threonine dehydrogenase-like Zn-dependent dehydrogenase